MKPLSSHIIPSLILGSLAFFNTLSAYATEPAIITIPSISSKNPTPLPQKLPENRQNSPSAEEIRKLWQAIDSGNAQDFKELSLRYQRIYPGWTVPSSMKTIQKQKEDDHMINTLFERKQKDKIETLINENPEKFGCSSPGNLWKYYDLQENNFTTEQKKEFLTTLIKTCAPSERLTALQKTQGLVSEKEMLSFLALPGKKHPQENILEQEIRSRIQEKDDGSLVRNFANLVNTATETTPAPSYLGMLEQRASQTRDKNLLSLVGWWHYKKQNIFTAERFFKESLQAGYSKSAQEGLLYTALSQNKTEEATSLAKRLGKNLSDFSTGTALSEKEKLFISASQNKDFKTCWTLGNHLSLEKPNMILMHAWCGLSIDPETSETLFQAVLEKTNDERLQKEAFEGLLLTTEKTGNTQKAEIFLEDLPLSKQNKKYLEQKIAITQFVSAYNQKNYTRSVEALAFLEKSHYEMTPEQQLLSGWAYFNAGDCGKAWNVFNAMRNIPNPKLAQDAENGFKAVNGSYQGKQDSANYCIDTSKK